MKKIIKKKKVQRPYKTIGMCLTCRERYVVDFDQKYTLRNYCPKCIKKFKLK